MRIFLLAGIAALLCCCSSKPHQKSRMLDSLLLCSSIDEVRTLYGIANVKELPPGTGEEGPYQAVAVFPGTSQEATLYWYSESDVKARDYYYRTAKTGIKGDGSAGFIWKTAKGVYPGMKLSEIKDLLHADVKIWQPYDSTHPMAIAEESIAGLAALMNDSSQFEALIELDPAFHFSSSVAKENYNSAQDEAHAKNPIVWAISLNGSYARPAPVPDEDKMEHMVDSLALFIDSLKFNVRAGRIPFMELPFNELPDPHLDPIFMDHIPREFFTREECFYGYGAIIGMLPDTTSYYGLVWQITAMMKTLPKGDRYPNTFITTFTKEWQLIQKAQTVLDINVEGPTDCNKANIQVDGNIEADLTINSFQNIETDCNEGENGTKHYRYEYRLTGRVLPNGKIELKETEKTLP